MARTNGIKKDQEVDLGQIFFNWKFAEFPKHERSRNWYLLTGIAIVGLLLFAIFTNNFLFGLIVLLSAITLTLFQLNIKEVDFKIAEDGIVVNSRLYPYDTVKNFFIIYQPPEVKTMYFEMKGFFVPRIPISLGDQDPLPIREILIKYLEEDLSRENEPVSDQFSRFFKI